MKRKIISAFFVLFLLLVSNSSAQSNRISGINRYETAAKVSQSQFEKNDIAVIVYGENYPDALCAAPFAKIINAPILLTTKNNLNTFTKQEIKRLEVKKVFLIGGTQVISSNIEIELINMGIDVERISGQNRYETSIKIANRIKQNKNYSEVFLTSGENYPDALSSASIAAIKEIPILLTRKTSLPDEIESFIKKETIDKTYVIGSINAIYGVVANSMPNPIRIGGKNRFETNTKILDFFKQEINLNKLYVSIGQGPTNTEYADALTGSVVAAINNTAILLTKKDLVSEAELFIKYNLKNTTNVFILGGSNAVSINQQYLIDDIVKKIPNEDKWETIKTVMGFNKHELIDIKLRFDRCINQAKTENTRAIITKASELIEKILNDPEYNYLNEVENIKQLKLKLTQSEKDNLMDIFINNFLDLDLSKIYNLKTSLGL